MKEQTACEEEEDSRSGIKERQIQVRSKSRKKCTHSNHVPDSKDDNDGKANVNMSNTATNWALEQTGEETERSSCHTMLQYI